MQWWPLSGRPEEIRPGPVHEPDHLERSVPDRTAAPKARKSRRSKTKPSCGSCYFGVRMLCALELGGPCTTFRPDSPHGLIPPTQPMLLIGTETVELAAA
jgi:hypothetical protein